jgi:hypothetical protein
VFNLTQPEKSLLLLAPLTVSDGGWGLCRESGATNSSNVFASREDADYQALLALCSAGKRWLDVNKRFDMPDFKPRPDWVREMRRYGVLEADVSVRDVGDCYAIERRYWESLWHQPARP